MGNAAFSTKGCVDNFKEEYFENEAITIQTVIKDNPKNKFIPNKKPI